MQKYHFCLTGYFTLKTKSQIDEDNLFVITQEKKCQHYRHRMQTSKIHKICTTIHRKTKVLHFKICYLYPNDATIRKCLSILAVGIKTQYQPLKEKFKMARHPLYSKTPDKGNSWLIKCRIMQNLVYRNLSWKTVQKYCPNAQPILL